MGSYQDALFMLVNCFKRYLKKACFTQVIVGKHLILCLLGVALTSKQLVHPKGRVRKKETAYKS